MWKQIWFYKNIQTKLWLQLDYSNLSGNTFHIHLLKHFLATHKQYRRKKCRLKAQNVTASTT